LSTRNFLLAAVNLRSGRCIGSKSKCKPRTRGVAALAKLGIEIPEG
jgi:hypothetical protein